MRKAEAVTVRCDRCGEYIRKGDDFVVRGKYPGVYRSWLRARWMGVGSLPEDFGEIYHPACYLEPFKERDLLGKDGKDEHVFGQKRG